MEGGSPFLPLEIITDFLKLLPAKSLTRLHCVSKDWKNLIKTPLFIAAHLHHSTQHRPCLLFNLLRNPKRFELYMLDYEMQIAEVQNIPVVDCVLQVVGSSNGLLCLRILRNANGIYRPHFFIWNPAIREVRQVTFPDFDGSCSTGFGLSPIVNDYKIVRIKNDFLVVEVYSLGRGPWKKIDVANFRGLIIANDVGFTMNGGIFRPGLKLGDHEYVIVSFAIAMEVFFLTPVPDTDITYGAGISFTEFEHRFAILCQPEIENPESLLIELWVLEEATGEELD